MITGQEKPDAGTIRIGDTVDLGYVDQSRDELNPDKNVWEEISDGLDMITLGKKSFRPALMSASSISKAAISRKKSGNCRAANATAFTWRKCCAKAPT